MTISYPDYTNSNHTPFPPSTKLPDTEKHWNQSLAAFTAIGTTILTAIQQISSILHQDELPLALTHDKATHFLTATDQQIIHITTSFTISAIFRSPPPPRQQQHRRHQTVPSNRTDSR